MHRDDLCASIKAGRLAPTLGASRTVRIGPVPGQARARRAVQGFAFGSRVGRSNADRNDRYFYIHLCGHLWRPIRLARHPMGLRAVHLLRTAPVVDVSGHFAAVGNYNRGAR